MDNKASYSTVEKLFEACERKISKEKIADWLCGQLTYTLHKPRKINFKRNPYILTNINEQLQADLIDMVDLSEANDDFKYILIVIDSFSRFVRVRPLKSKAGKDVLEALRSIFGELAEPPQQFLTDRGKEFFNNQIGNYLKSLKVLHIAPSDDTFKCDIVERAIRTFKSILYKVLTATLSLRYIDVLQKIAKTMNDRKNRSINMAPRDVNDENVYQVWKFMKKNRTKGSKRNCRNLLNPGDNLRISKNKKEFEKGFLPNYTDEIFKVLQRIDRQPHNIYKVEGDHGEKLDGFLYHDEIIRVKKDKNTLYRINKILKKRKRKGINEVLVEWKGGDKKKNNSWIAEADLV